MDALERLKDAASEKMASTAERDLALLCALPRSQAPLLLDYLPKSRAQLRQDLFVLSELDFKRGGFFVEFGATNGVDLSNTYLLESAFGWTGLLAEPARCWREALTRNRTAAIDMRCVWTTTGETLRFNEPTAAELSTLDQFSASDGHARARSDGARYEVETVSLLDLLKQHAAPRNIDYLSLDTEGSEYDILKNFDFGAYSFGCITVEHNHTPARESIHALLTGAGYARKHMALSDFDDWYVRAT